MEWREIMVSVMQLQVLNLISLSLSGNVWKHFDEVMLTVCHLLSSYRVPSHCPV